MYQKWYIECDIIRVQRSENDMKEKKFPENSLYDTKVPKELTEDADKVEDEDEDPEIEKLFEDFFNGIMDDDDIESLEKMVDYSLKSGVRPIEELLKKYNL